MHTYCFQSKLSHLKFTSLWISYHLDFLFEIRKSSPPEVLYPRWVKSETERSEVPQHFDELYFEKTVLSNNTAPSTVAESQLSSVFVLFFFLIGTQLLDPPLFQYLQSTHFPERFSHSTRPLGTAQDKVRARTITMQYDKCYNYSYYKFKLTNNFFTLSWEIVIIIQPQYLDEGISYDYNWVEKNKPHSGLSSEISSQMPV